VPAVRFQLHQANLDALLRSPGGPVAREITRKTLRVHAAAVRGAPVDQGRLRGSISWEMQQDARGVVGRVGTNLHYATYVERGTRTPIVPRNAKVLRFVGRGGRIVFAKRVRGQPPKRFLERALDAARG